MWLQLVPPKTGVWLDCSLKRSPGSLVTLLGPAQVLSSAYSTWGNLLCARERVQRHVRGQVTVAQICALLFVAGETHFQTCGDMPFVQCIKIHT